MRTCGRILDGNTVIRGTGGPMNIESPPPQGLLPHCNLNHVIYAVRREMYKDGYVDGGDIEFAQVENAYWTNQATGGCMPICAAEVHVDTQNRRHVLWTYLYHGFAGNFGKNITENATNANHIYAVMMCNTDNFHSLEAALNEVKYYMAVLDPQNQIPDQNAMLIYAPASSLAITSNAMIGVLPANCVVPPKPQKKSMFGFGKK
jgi:hypothetical protein